MEQEPIKDVLMVANFGHEDFAETDKVKADFKVVQNVTAGEKIRFTVASVAVV